MTTNTQQTAQGWCCTDCLVLFANGETPPELDEQATAEWLAKIDRSGGNRHTRTDGVRT